MGQYPTGAVLSGSLPFAQVASEPFLQTTFAVICALRLTPHQKISRWQSQNVSRLLTLYT